MTRLTLKKQIADIVKSVVSIQGGKEEDNGESEWENWALYLILQAQFQAWKMVSELGEKIKEMTFKPYNLNGPGRIQMVGGEKYLLQVLLQLPHAHCSMCIPVLNKYTRNFLKNEEIKYAWVKIYVELLHLDFLLRNSMAMI